MYNSRSRRGSQNRGRQSFRTAGNGNGGQKRNFSSPRRGRGAPKKLDHRMFINQATDTNVIEAQAVEIKHKFADFDINPNLKANIADHGYVIPTPIQDQTIPLILEGRDVIGIANTGTGKTAAFLIPLINKLFNNKHEKVLIVAPTRELALQINEEFRAFSSGSGLYSVTAIGGSSMHNQIRDMRRGYNFIIGTPGRIIDLIRQKELDLSGFHNVVLDEVDRMVDIGFIKDVQYLISLMPEKRHSLFFSATITDKVDAILNQFVKNPVTVSVKTHETAETIEQDVVHISNKDDKVEILHELLIKDGFDKVLVFGRTKWGIEKLTKALDSRGFKVAAIHGNKTQGNRQRALTAFKQNKIQVLLATDVASRGIDVSDVTHVINYDAPESYDDYVHRIGRTGRANKRGMAITFVE